MTTAHSNRHLELAEQPGAMLSHGAGRTLAVLRIITGAVFLWAFLDKAFGWHYATPGGKGWLSGGSPTKGFLSNVEVGPLQETFHSLAGDWWVDALFMTGLLAIGTALVLGVALRPAALSGALMMGLMWLAEFPPAQHTTGGDLTRSTNPLLDYHVVYALVLLVVAVTYAGDRWGLGRRWAGVDVVRNHEWLR